MNYKTSLLNTYITEQYNIKHLSSYNIISIVIYIYVCVYLYNCVYINHVL